MWHPTTSLAPSNSFRRRPLGDSEVARILGRVVSVAHDVGLLSGEYHVRSHGLLGDVPRALTHLGLINTALFLSGPVIQRAGA